MDKTFSIKVLFGIYLLLMAGKVFAFSCNVDGGSSIGAGTPVGAAGGVVIKAGEVIARIHMYKIATLGSGNPRNFTWHIISNKSIGRGCLSDA